MRKLITLLALVLLVSCQNPPHCTYKYKKGDIVYLKLDGTKVMVVRQVLFIEEEPNYEVYYKSSKGSYGSDVIPEFCLIDKLP